VSGVEGYGVELAIVDRVLETVPLRVGLGAVCYGTVWRGEVWQGQVRANVADRVLETVSLPMQQHQIT
jgi:hypothetical protein